ncbi:MAG: ABC transporter substrate-binding protein [Deinococcota bacterium]
MVSGRSGAAKSSRIGRGMCHGVYRGVRVGVVLILVSLLAWVALAQSSANVLRAAVPVDPETIDPHIGANTVHSVWMALVYETLIALDKNGDPAPGLAESWTISEDGTVYTFNLRDDVRWHNGRALVAEDVKFNLERIQNPDVGATQTGQLSPIVDIQTPDESTVVLTLDASNAAILSEIGVQGRVGLAAPEAFDADGNLLTPIGTGPFTLAPEDYIVNDSLRLQTNEDYWRGRATIDGIDLVVIPDNLARLIAVSSGDVDFAWDVPGLQATFEAQAGNINLQEVITNESNWLSLNTQNPKLADPRVRRALLLAMSRNDIVAAGWNGFATPVFQPFVESSFWHVDIPSQRNDARMEEAQALLEEAGVSSGDITMTILSWDASGTQMEAEVVASAWTQLGVRTSVESIDTASMLDRATRNDFDAIYAFVAFVYDPNRPYNYFNQNWNLNGLSGGLQSEALTSLFEQGQQTSDPDTRREIYGQLVNSMYEDEPSFIYTVRKSSFVALSPQVEGYTQGNLLAVSYAEGEGIMSLSLGGN